MVWEMGLIIECNEECFKVLCSNHKTRLFRNNIDTGCCKIGVGEWIDWDEENGDMINRKPKFPAKIVDGELHIETLACCSNPMQISSKENRAKWENVLWSPHIGVIRDDGELFLPLNADELYAVKVKYCGGEKSLWELVSVGMRCEDLKVQLAVAQAPWTLEQIEAEIEGTSKKDHLDHIIGRKKIDDKNTYAGFVYQRDEKGFFWIWGHSTGKASVWINEKPELGNWYSFCLKSISFDSLQRANKRFRIFAMNLVNIHDRLEACRLSPTEFGTRIRVKMHPTIIQDKYCWDYVLGKVEIPNRLISTIEKLTKTPRSDGRFYEFEVVGIANILSTSLENAEMCWSFQNIEQILE